MSKRAATDFDNSHTRISNIEDGDKGSGPVSGPVLSDPPANAPSDMKVNDCGCSEGPAGRQLHQVQE